MGAGLDVPDLFDIAFLFVDLAGWAGDKKKPLSETIRERMFGTAALLHGPASDLSAGRRRVRFTSLQAGRQSAVMRRKPWKTGICRRPARSRGARGAPRD